MARDFIIGCVGKPSSGKSTFFNAVCANSNAKAAPHPFTTIEPNQGVVFFTTHCPCTRFGVKCRPNYGTCKNGIREVAVKLLDVAGLIPGAHEGRGIGNKFLDDLRHAHVLLHIIDVTGNTNEKGEATEGYDPSNDHEWLQTEIELWIYKRLLTKWPTMAKRHAMKNANVVNTLLSQLSGYMATESLIAKVLDLMNVRTDQFVDLCEWSQQDVREFTRVFVKERFKFVLVLNKADSGNVNENSLKICSRHPDVPAVMCSALAACFLRKMKREGYIEYESAGDFYMYQDSADDARNQKLKPLDDKLRQRLGNIRDLVLYRFGSTGVIEALNTAIQHAGIVCVYPIYNLKTFGTNEVPDRAFPQVVLAQPGTIIEELVRGLDGITGNVQVYLPNGMQLSLDKQVTKAEEVIYVVSGT